MFESSLLEIAINPNSCVPSIVNIHSMGLSEIRCTNNVGPEAALTWFSSFLIRQSHPASHNRQDVDNNVHSPYLFQL